MQQQKEECESTSVLYTSIYMYTRNIQTERTYKTKHKEEQRQWQLAEEKKPERWWIPPRTEHISLGTHTLTPDYWGGWRGAKRRDKREREGGRGRRREREARERDDASCGKKRGWRR